MSPNIYILKKNKIFSPLAISIASKENIDFEKLSSINGSGVNGKIIKKDLLNFINENKKKELFIVYDNLTDGKVSEEIILMNDYLKRNSGDSSDTQKISPHVTSFAEADITELINWRNKVKDDFYRKEGAKLSYLVLFLTAVVKAIKSYPLINSSLSGINIIRKKRINIGFTLFLNNRTIIPVIKNADYFNLSGLAKTVHDYYKLSGENKLPPENFKDGTFTITNYGMLGCIMNTPLIIQPQVAILGVGQIRKKLCAININESDGMSIRYVISLSLSYDHRIIDGALGGSFLREVADILENFKPDKLYQD